MCTFEYQYLILTLNRFDYLFEFEIRFLAYVECRYTYCEMFDLPSVSRPYCLLWVDGLGLGCLRLPLGLVSINGLDLGLLGLARLIRDPTMCIRVASLCTFNELNYL
jgi:hypothetical protein